MSESEEENDGPRFWIVTDPEVKPFGEPTVAVVDEHEGGIVAYFMLLDDAQKFCEMMENASA